LQQLHRKLKFGAFTGEYIAAEKIEAAYKKNGMVEQIWVYGNSFESTLVAIVVPTGKTTCALIVYNVVHFVSLCMPYQPPAPLWAVSMGMLLRMGPQHSTAQHSTAQHSTAQHSTAQHSMGNHQLIWQLPHPGLYRYGGRVSVGSPTLYCFDSCTLHVQLQVLAAHKRMLINREYSASVECCAKLVLGRQS